MQIERTDIDDIVVFVPPKRGDNRGFFSETYNRKFFAAQGVDAEFVQDNHAFSADRGVLRGLHYQTPPRAQGKLIRCVRGAILDVVVDIRQGSPSYGRHVAIELSATNWKQVWVPPGFAHGYVTLVPDCEVIYKVTDYWAPECERGIAWNDPNLDIDWRVSRTDLTLSDKDQKNPLLAEAETVFHYDQRKL